MRFRLNLFSWLGIMLALSACAAPLLLMSPQGQLMWALLKPMVGLNPNQFNFFEQSLIKNRLEPLLGPHYGTAVSLLKTANKLQQEGPLYFLISEQSPIPDLAEKAGFVWNAETNQMAVMLVTGGVSVVFAEQAQEQIQKVVPSWPAELAPLTNPAALREKLLADASGQLVSQLPIDANQQAALTVAAQGKSLKQIGQQQVQQQLLAPVVTPITDFTKQTKQQVLDQQQQLSHDLVQAPADLLVTTKQQIKEQVLEKIDDEVDQQIAAVNQPITGAAATAALHSPLVAVTNSATQSSTAAGLTLETAAKTVLPTPNQLVTTKQPVPDTSPTATLENQMAALFQDDESFPTATATLAQTATEMTPLKKDADRPTNNPVLAADKSATPSATAANPNERIKQATKLLQQSDEQLQQKQAELKKLQQLAQENKIDPQLESQLSHAQQAVIAAKAAQQQAKQRYDELTKQK